MPDQGPREDPALSDHALPEERWELLAQLHALLAKPLLALSFVWIGLAILAVTRGLGRPLQRVDYGIWALFAGNFALEFAIAPHKREYLRRHWLTGLSLLLPAFGVLRVVRVLRLVRVVAGAPSLHLLRLVALFNRSLRALRATFGRRNFGFVVALTAIVILAGVGGMLQFESPAALRQAGHADVAAQGAGLHTYPEAVWWTAMLMTTMGSAYWPITGAGRLLCWLLALYAFTVFGYITATLASHFVDVDQADQRATASAAGSAEIASLHREIAAVQRQLAALLARGAVTEVTARAAEQKPE